MSSFFEGFQTQIILISKNRSSHQKKRLWHRCFPLEVREIFKNTTGRLLLHETFFPVLPLEYFETTFEDLYFFQLPLNLFLSCRIYTISRRKEVF